MTGEGIRISLPKGVNQRAFVVFERCVGVWVSGPESSFGKESRTFSGSETREKAALGPESGVGEGHSGRGAQTRSPRGSRGRGWQAPGSWTSGFPSPTPSGPCAHALREGGGGSSQRHAEPSGDCSVSSTLMHVPGAIGPHFPEAPGLNCCLPGR